MDNKSKKKIAKQYDELVKKYGDNIDALHTNNARYNKEHQDIKFQFVYDQLGNYDSLLDVGCGLGHLADFCKDRGWHGKYTGIDLSGEMVDIVKKKLKTDKILKLDILEEKYEDKHDVVASISTLQEKPPFEESYSYLQNMIAKMFQIAKKCLVLDIFSNKFSDYENPNNLYVNPSVFLNDLYKLTNRLIILNHYNPYQLTVILYKKQLNGWSI